MDLSSYGWLARATCRAERRLSRTPDLILANSFAGAKHSICNGFPESKIEVVPNGVETNRFRPDAALRSRQRRIFGLEDDQIAVGVLARLDPMKGHPTFLLAASMVAASPMNLRFFCIGDGAELFKLKQMAEELGLSDRVNFTGGSDPVAALNALDIVCSSSRWGEGFSNSIAEAMACGLPCIVTDVGDSAMIVGPTGTVVPPDSPRALAEAILAQASSLARHDPEAPRERVIELFSREVMVSRTLDTFRRRLGFDA
jgi:glycosyltransferase involved in cell wall biosynthesis